MFRIRSVSRIAVFSAALAAASAQGLAAQQHQHGQPQPARPQQQQVLSPRDTVHADLGGGKHLMIDYGRPSMRGRRIMGELVPFGRVWRTGANAATTLVAAADLQIGDAAVPRGTDTRDTNPPPRGWTLIVNRQTGQWGTQYDASRDLVRIPMQVSTVQQPVEQFTIAVEPARNGEHTLVLSWENTRATVPVRVVRPGSRSR